MHEIFPPNKFDFFLIIVYNEWVRIAINNGVWLSLVERMVRDHEAGGSNPLTPTINH